MVSTKISGSEIENQTLIGEVSHFWEKGVSTATTTLLAASAHHPLRMLTAYVQLVEVPDSAGTTVTVKLQNNGTDATNTLTFTAVTFSNNTGSVNSSAYWGSYLYSDYDMPSIKANASNKYNSSFKYKKSDPIIFC